VLFNQYLDFPMNRRYITTVLAYVVVTLFCAAAWHLGLFGSIYRDLGAFTREKPIIPLGLLSMLIQGLVIAWLYPRVRLEGKPVVRGLVFGLMMGLFMGSNAVLAEAGKNEVGSIPTWIVVEGLFYIIWPAVIGILVAQINRQTE